jgi:hypothetical protein
MQHAMLILVKPLGSFFYAPANGNSTTSPFAATVSTSKALAPEVTRRTADQGPQTWIAEA